MKGPPWIPSADLNVALIAATQTGPHGVKGVRQGSIEVTVVEHERVITASQAHDIESTEVLVVQHIRVGTASQA